MDIGESSTKEESVNEYDKPFPWDLLYCNRLNVYKLLKEDEKKLIDNLKDIFPSIDTRFIIHSIKHPDKQTFNNDVLRENCINDLLNFTTGRELKFYDKNKKHKHFNFLKYDYENDDKSSISVHAGPAINNLITEILNIFEDAYPCYVDDLVKKQRFINENTLQYLCNHMITNGYIKKPKKRTMVNVENNNIPEKIQKVELIKNLWESYICPDSTLVRQCFMNEFCQLRLDGLRFVLKIFNNHYASARKFLIASIKKNEIDYTYQQIYEVDNSKIKFYCIKFNNKIDKTVSITLDVPNKESKTIHRLLGCRAIDKTIYENVPIWLTDQLCENEISEMDEEIAKKINAEEYRTNEQTIDCGCCYGDFPFEDMVQCADGHLFCKDCLRSYVKECVYGEGRTSLICLAGSCEANFLRSQLLSVLDSTTINKLDERLEFENINTANINDLMSCPFCNYKVIVPENNKVLDCEKCSRSSCKLCKEDWEEHFGKRCNEIEKKGEVVLRTKFEEDMTRAKIRRCNACQMPIIKSEGCNKMTCRCGAKMCYICRIKINDYTHFCNHPKDPKDKRCKSCKKCMLFTDVEADDALAIKEIQTQATLELEKSSGNKKIVGTI